MTKTVIVVAVLMWVLSMFSEKSEGGALLYAPEPSLFPTLPATPPVPPGVYHGYACDSWPEAWKLPDSQTLRKDGRTLVIQRGYCKAT